MSKWIKPELLRFDSRIIRVRIGRADAINGGLKFLTERDYDVPTQSPRIVEEAVRELISKQCPALSECSIIGLSFDFGSLSWEVIIEHPSFEPVPQGCETKVVPLKELEVA